MPAILSQKKRRAIARMPSAKHKIWLAKVPLMGEDTLATIEIICVEELPLPKPIGARAHPCVALKKEDFSFARRSPFCAGKSAGQKVRVFSPLTPRASAIAAIIASRHFRNISPDKGLVIIDELGIKTESTSAVSTAPATAEKVLVGSALQKIYANWKNVERVIIVVDARLFREIVSQIYIRMFCGESLPRVIPGDLSDAIRVLIDVKSKKVRFSRR